MKVLKDFLNSLDFVRMKPDKSFIKSGVASDARVRALAEPGRQYALYFKGGTNANLTLDLPKGNYRVEWVDGLTGEIAQREQVKHAGGEAVLAPKKYTNEITLRILARRF